MSSTYTAVSQKFTCVFLNYKHKDVESFETALKDRRIWEKYNLSRAETEIVTDAPPEMISGLSIQFSSQLDYSDLQFSSQLDSSDFTLSNSQSDPRKSTQGCIKVFFFTGELSLWKKMGKFLRVSIVFFW